MPREPVSGEPESVENTRYECDLCGKQFRGSPPSSGMFMWTRGDEIRTEEPPLCEDCAKQLSLGALLAFEEE